MAKSEKQYIKIRGANEHNLKNLDVNVLSVSNGDVASRVASYSYTYSSSSK